MEEVFIYDKNSVEEYRLVKFGEFYGIQKLSVWPSVFGNKKYYYINLDSFTYIDFEEAKKWLFKFRSQKKNCETEIIDL